MAKRIVNAVKSAVKKIIRICVQGATTVHIDKLEPFQGELKRIDRDEYERLRKTILDDGFSFVFHVWIHDKKHYIIDGHQRLFTLKQLQEEEGYEIPKLPVAIVEAKNIKEARRKVLLAISQHGKLTDKSLEKYMRENDIPVEDLVSTFSLPGIDVAKFMAKFNGAVDLPKIEINVNQPDMRHSSDGVRQVQLFFNGPDHDEFMSKIQMVAQKLDMESISDALLQVVREAHKGYFKK